MGKVWRDHWDFGRWGLAKTGVEWGGDNSIFALTAVLLKVSDVGALRAMGNLALPLSHISAAVGRLVQPYVARIAGRQGAVRQNRRDACPFPLRGRSLSLLAGDRHFVPAFGPARLRRKVRLLGSSCSVDRLRHGVLRGRLLLRLGTSGASGAFRLLVIAAVTAITVVATGIPLAWLFGLKGVVAAECVASVATVTAAWYLFNRRVRNEKQDAAEVPGV